MLGHRITLRLEGTEPGQDGNVRLSDFLDQLAALRKVLRETEEVVAGQSVLDWQVVDLSHSSPAMVAVEPIFARDADVGGLGDHRAEVVGGFFSYLRALSANTAPPELSSSALEAFHDLAAPSRLGRLRATISNGAGPQIEIAPSVQKTVIATLAPTMKTQGSVKGRLEYLNIHAESNVFRIYSPVIPRYVVCHFAGKTLGTAKEAMGRKVAVQGQLTYHSRDPFPRSIAVEAIQVVPDDLDLPRLLDLRGLAPNATGGLLSEDYVRGLRSEQP